MADDTEFEPAMGRMRNQRARTYLGRAIAAANLAGGRIGKTSPRQRCLGARIGRGAGVGRVLAQRGARASFRSRRVIVKASIVRLAGKGAARASAHLSYLLRDGTTRAGDPGSLYGRDSDLVDGAAFRGRGATDRYQFRFVVSAEDGAEYEDLKPLTRRLMARVQEDLGVKLDWVAVDHFDTGHPHTHVVVRGKDQLGGDVVIASEYLTTGIRERASELIDLDLGPRSARDVQAGLRAEVQQERLTSLDRSLARDMDADRTVCLAYGSPFDRALRAGRLAKLGTLGLAEPIGDARWRLAADFDATLREIGERGDIIRTMQRAFASRGLARAPVDQVIYDPKAAQARQLVGRVVERGLADEHAARHYLIIDGLDGRTHFVGIGRGADLEHLCEGAVVKIEPLRAETRDADRIIVAVAAANGNRYDVEAHLRHDPSATAAFAGSHLRHLEAMRRLSGSATREPSGQWIIATDHLARAEAHAARVLRDRPISVEILSVRPLAHLIDADAATWLDRDLIGAQPLMARNAGFGAEMRDAQDRRRQWLIAQDLAVEDNAGTRYAAGMLGILQRRELLRVAGRLSEETGLSFVETRPGARIDGVFRQRIEAISCRFALIENSREFTLVPWQPPLERQLGKPVLGIMRSDSVSWSIGRGRGGPTIS
ncbi:relaxase/mobilization nuclease RlxS [Sphingomonas sp. BIUV-7]|uniref:Relaxase/mobilization nuclease RlxS n=1 Tax=Sphingomonas natans TaxID=3063330 RepID=A0ABT8YF62_9SPHN|nr:relaxase/mobilization nuclease RlxS [Sphingomonas sp. BIUV-7]MDO6416250.1 relaxase/mobilization nuclease RlxS [Sphingomonas sp. BIUV-7]